MLNSRQDNKQNLNSSIDVEENKSKVNDIETGPQRLQQTKKGDFFLPKDNGLTQTASLYNFSAKTKLIY